MYVSVGGRHPGRAGPGEGLHVGVTGPDGHYVIRNLPQWDAPVIVYPDTQPFGVRWSGGATDLARAKPVSILWATRTAFNLKLAPEARLAVTVSGAPTGENLLVDPVGSNGSVIGLGSDLIGDGTTTVGQLPAGRVRLRITMLPSNRVFYYDGATTLAAATPIATTAGATSSITVQVPAA